MVKTEDFIQMLSLWDRQYERSDDRKRFDKGFEQWKAINAAMKSQPELNEVYAEWKATQ